MHQSYLRPLFAVGLVVALLCYVGCNSPSNEPKAQTDTTTTPAKPATTDAPKAKNDPQDTAKGTNLARPDFANWPTPAGVLVISGEQLGYLEPCGCTEGQKGGLLRRYDMINRLRNEKKWPVGLIDLGSLIKDPNASRGGPEQTKLKYLTALRALANLKYDAVALSPEDLKVGVDEVVGQLLNMPGDHTKFVAANVKAAGLESKVVPSVVLTIGTVKVGVTAVVDPEKLKALRDPSLDLLAITPIAEALPKLLADLEKTSQIQVLMVQGAPEDAKAIAEKFPGFDIVVGTSTTPDPPSNPEPLNGGKTLHITVGQRGKYAGVLGLFNGPSKPFQYKLVDLDTRYDGDAKPMKAIIENEFRDMLKNQGIVENFPRHDYVNGAPGATFVGADNCKVCHAKAFEKWDSTGHAQAFGSLLDDPKPNTQFDAECVSCHTTGFEYNSGWKSAVATPYLKGNQCENCHGPASKHVEKPDDKDLRAFMHVSVTQADKNRLCLRCHDDDNSPHFNFEKYWKQIDHSGLDKYDDPSVHKGRPAKLNMSNDQ